MYRSKTRWHFKMREKIWGTRATTISSVENDCRNKEPYSRFIKHSVPRIHLSADVPASFFFHHRLRFWSICSMNLNMHKKWHLKAWACMQIDAILATVKKNPIYFHYIIHKEKNLIEHIIKKTWVSSKLKKKFPLIL